VFCEVSASIERERCRKFVSLVPVGDFCRKSRSCHSRPSTTPQAGVPRCSRCSRTVGLQRGHCINPPSRQIVVPVESVFAGCPRVLFSCVAITVSLGAYHEPKPMTPQTGVPHCSPCLRTVGLRCGHRVNPPGRQPVPPAQSACARDNCSTANPRACERDRASPDSCACSAAFRSFSRHSKR
jgi:hypothetical protein